MAEQDSYGRYVGQIVVVKVKTGAINADPTELYVGKVAELGPNYLKLNPMFPYEQDRGDALFSGLSRFGIGRRRKVEAMFQRLQERLEETVGESEYERIFPREQIVHIQKTSLDSLT